MVVLDLSAAFDTVNNGFLINRLRSRIGIAGPALEWVRSYISDRTHSAGIGADFSELVQVDIGVPHGPVLGPLFFLVIYPA